jgi:hypothetical protein
VKKNKINRVVFIAIVVLSVSVLTFGRPMDQGESTFSLSSGNTVGLNISSTSNVAFSSDFIEALKDPSDSKIQLIPDIMLEKIIPSCISDLEIDNFKVSTPAGEKDVTSERRRNNPLGFVLQ